MPPFPSLSSRATRARREGPQRGGAEARPQPERAHDVEVVLARGRVVLEAAEDDAVERGADPALRRLHPREAQVAPVEVDAVEVARDPGVGAQHHGNGGVLVLSGLLVVAVAEAYAVGERA